MKDKFKDRQQACIRDRKERDRRRMAMYYQVIDRRSRDGQRCTPWRTWLGQCLWQKWEEV